MSARDQAVAAKNEGNKYFKTKNWAKAIEEYTKGVMIDNTYHILYSNRSQAYYASGKYEEAAQDGKWCIQTSPKDFVKGYHRLANAQFALKDYKGALGTCQKAERNGFRGNKDISRMYEKCIPLAKQQEEAILSKLKGNARLKAVGNGLFKKGQYQSAIENYTKVCNSLDDEVTGEDKEILISCLNNRALCFMQQQDYRQVIMDTTRSIGLDDTIKNIKAYFRRATAFEGIEKYRSALDDIRKCTQANPRWDAANKAQYRLDQAVRTLKKAKA